MLRFAALAMVGALSAAGAAQTVIMLNQANGLPALRRAEPATTTAAAALSAPAPETPGTAASVSKASDGHFWAEGQVNGQRVRFLVDTGATAVALTAEDATRLGFDPHRLAYGLSVTTANGQARAAQIKLASVSVAGARVADVDALVIEKGLPSSLLGMTYLGRLSRFEATPTALILRP